MELTFIRAKTSYTIYAVSLKETQSVWNIFRLEIEGVDYNVMCYLPLDQPLGSPRKTPEGVLISPMAVRNN